MVVILTKTYLSYIILVTITPLIGSISFCSLIRMIRYFALSLRILKFDLTYITDKFHISKVFRFIMYNVNLGTSIGALRGA